MGKALEIAALTGLRFIAAGTIVFAHFAEGSYFSLFGLRSPISVIGMPLFFDAPAYVMTLYFAIERPGKAWLRAAFSGAYGSPRTATRRDEPEDAAARIAAGR